jgi:hypothetical protein
VPAAGPSTAIPTQWALTLFVMALFFLYAVGCAAATALERLD